jgi:hypothetical protein
MAEKKRKVSPEAPLLAVPWPLNMARQFEDFNPNWGFFLDKEMRLRAGLTLVVQQDFGTKT